MNQEAGRLDRRKLAAIQTGATNVFSKNWQKDGFRTCVSILVDTSSSMRDTQIEGAQQLAVVLGDALTAAQVPFNLVTFDTQQLGKSYSHKKDRGFVDGNGQKTRMTGAQGFYAPDMVSIQEAKCHDAHGAAFTRIEGVGGSIVKGFSDNWSNRVGLVPLIYSRGGTPLGAALAWAGCLIRQRPEERKVIIVLTDGQIDDQVSEVIELIEQWGIESIGIGLEDPVSGYSCVVSDHFKVAVDNCKAADISTKILDTLIAESEKQNGDRQAA